MAYTDMADELFGAAYTQKDPSGVRLATMRRGGVTITRVEIARDGLKRPRGRYVTLEVPKVSVLDERDSAVIETSDCVLNLSGAQLSVTSLDLERGEAKLSGRIDALEYTEARTPGGLLRRLIR